jgi:hypothetical protein
MANIDTKRLGYIEGGVFEYIEAGDDRNATVAHIKMPDGFRLSARAVIVVEVDEWDFIGEQLRMLRGRFPIGAEADVSASTNLPFSKEQE